MTLEHKCECLQNQIRSMALSHKKIVSEKDKVISGLKAKIKDLEEKLQNQIGDSDEEAGY